MLSFRRERTYLMRDVRRRGRRSIDTDQFYLLTVNVNVNVVTLTVNVKVTHVVAQAR